MLAIVLIAAVPAFAQATAGNISAQYINCAQVQSATAGQYGTAASGTVAQQLGISQTQVNACLGGVAVSAPGPVFAGPTGTLVTTSGAPVFSASASTSATAVSALPPTGGASLIALGTGVLLVGGGLVARRLIR